MGSHSVTFHLTQVNTPRLNPSQTGSTYLPRKHGRLSWPTCRGDRLHPHGITQLPATRHKWTHPALTPAGQARLTYPGRMEGWADLHVGVTGYILRWFTHQQTVTHPSTNMSVQEEVELATCWVRCPNNYATKQPYPTAVSKTCCYCEAMVNGQSLVRPELFTSQVDQHWPQSHVDP